MKGIPFLLIVLISVGAVYAWTIHEGFAQYSSYSEMLKARGKSIIDEEAVDVVEVNKAKREGRPVPVPVAKPRTSPGLADAVNVANSQAKVGSNVGTRPQDMASGAAPAAPYGVVSDTAPSLYTDPDNIGISLNDLTELKRNITGFMQFEMPNYKSQSDPTIQLPLSSLKADYERLEAEETFLRRNPGQPSSIKGREFKEIADNLKYLQDKYRRFKQNDVQGVTTGVAKGASGTVKQKVEERATLADLKSVRTRMIAERARLGAGGSLEPVINARMAAISNMIEDLNGIIEKVEARTLLESEIPIFKSDIDLLFKTLTDTSKPIPGLMRSALPPGIANLLPPGMGKDAETQALIAKLADKYAGDFLKGVSVELGAKVKYTSENEARAGSGPQSTFDRAFGPLVTDQDRQIAQQSMLGTANQGFPTVGSLNNTAASDQLMPKPVAGDVYDPYAYNPVEGQRRPSGRDPLPITGSASGFDWKTRAKQICENARKMGLNPADFGCLPDSATVSPQFSWRGYAKMICNRLQTHYYQGTDEACGCPPIGWPGWISAAGEAAQ